MNNYRQNFLVHVLIVVLTWVLCMCIGLFVGPVASLTGAAQFFWNWSVACHWLSTGLALWYLYKWSNQGAWADCMENMPFEARISMCNAMADLIKKHDSESASEEEEVEVDEDVTNVGGTRQDTGKDEEGVYLLLDGYKLRNWCDAFRPTEYWNLHLEASDYVTISIHAERALFASREKGIDYRFSVALMAGEDREFVVTYCDDESISALAEKVQEDTGFDTTDINYGYTAEEAALLVRKLTAYLSDK